MSVLQKVEKEISLDDILMKFNLSGRYYVVFITLIFLVHVGNSVSTYNYVFVAEKVNYRCLDERFGNDSCASLSNSTEVCTEWMYDNPHSFVAEFQLACEEWKRTFIGSVHCFGYGVGLLIIGPLSDRYGRKKLIATASVIGAFSGIAKSLTSYYWFFIILEFLEASLGDSFSPAYILMIEMVAHEKRVLTKIFCSFGCVLGHGLLPLIAWLCPYWRNFLLIIYVPTILFASYFFLLDESPRWLLSKGRKEDAVAILDKTAKRSNVMIDKEIYSHLVYGSNEGVTLMQSLKHTFSSRVLVKRFLICLVWWISVTFIAYGICLNTVLLPGNKYMNYGLMSIVEIPARLANLLILTKFGRKIPLMSAFFLTSIFCCAQAFTPQSLQWLSVSFYLGAKFMVTIFFAVIYIFTSELFPTYTRNSMHALCSAIGRVGSVISTQTPLLMVFWNGLPSLTFAAVSLIAGITTLFVPDPANDSLPDTVQEAEIIGHKDLPSHIEKNNKD